MLHSLAHALLSCSTCVALLTRRVDGSHMCTRAHLSAFPDLLWSRRTVVYDARVCVVYVRTRVVRSRRAQRLGCDRACRPPAKAGGAQSRCHSSPAALWPALSYINQSKQLVDSTTKAPQEGACAVKADRWGHAASTERCPGRILSDPLII